VPCDHRRWGICDCRKTRHRRGTAREEAWLTVRPASWVGTDDPRRERGAGRANCGAAGPKDLGVRRLDKGRVRPGAGYPADLRHVPRLGPEEVPVREAPTASVLTLSRPTESHMNRRLVCWQCGDAGHLRKECPRRPAKEVVDKRDWRRTARRNASGVRGAGKCE
jgi:hypothetical protein